MSTNLANAAMLHRDVPRDDVPTEPAPLDDRQAVLEAIANLRFQEFAAGSRQDLQCPCCEKLQDALLKAIDDLIERRLAAVAPASPAVPPSTCSADAGLLVTHNPDNQWRGLL